jgi:ubiquinone biosynthesis accessory factor UbiK
MFTAKFFQDFSKQFSESLPPPFQALRKEFEQQFYQGLLLAFTKMNIVTREEFDIQTLVLERTREKVLQLKQKLDVLESRLSEQGLNPTATINSSTESTGEPSFSSKESSSSGSENENLKS